MRAKTVNFERGGDPKEAMDIGDIYSRHQKIMNLRFTDYPWIEDLIQDKSYEEIFDYKGIYHIIYTFDNGKYGSTSNWFENPKNPSSFSVINISDKKTKKTVIRNIISRTDKWLKERNLEEAIPLDKYFYIK